MFKLIVLELLPFSLTTYLDVCGGSSSTWLEFLKARFFLWKTSGALQHWLSYLRRCEGIKVSFPSSALTPAPITGGAGAHVWTISSYLVMRTLLKGILYPNTFKFCKWQRWEGKLNFKKSKIITISEDLLLYILNINSVCNCEAFTMWGGICTGRCTKGF